MSSFFLFYSDDLTAIQRAEQLDWEVMISGIAKDIVDEQSPSK